MEEQKFINRLCQGLREKGLDGDKVVCVPTTPFDMPVAKSRSLKVHVSHLVRIVNRGGDEEIDLFLPSALPVVNTHSDGLRILLSAVLCLDRFVTNNPEFVITSRNVYSLVVTSINVNAKYMIDEWCENREIACRMDIPVTKFNKCESLFSSGIGFNFRVSDADYVNFVNKFV